MRGVSPSFGTALDIGAHIGAVSVYLARKFERVIAFEAVPATFEFLRLNAADIPNITALNVAVGPTAGEVYLSHYPRHGQLSHVDGGIPAGKDIEDRADPRTDDRQPEHGERVVHQDRCRRV